MRRTLIGVTGGLFGFALACELLFRMLPVSTATLTDYHIDPAILGYPPNHEWRVATGWDLRNSQPMRSNNYGFVSGSDFTFNPRAVALVGDSYVESSMLPSIDRPGQQLERLLANGRPVFAFGSPGTALLDYAERIRLAYHALGVRDFVVLMEAADLRQSVCGADFVQGECLDLTTNTVLSKRLPGPSAIKQVMRHSAVAQYVGGQLKVEPTRLMRGLFARSVPQHQDEKRLTRSRQSLDTITTASAQRMVDAVTDAFLARMEVDAPGARLVFVVDGQRGGGESPPTTLAVERSRFIARARHLGLVVIDAEPLYAQHRSQSTLALAVGPYDNHLNTLGVRLVMAAAAGAIR